MPRILKVVRRPGFACALAVLLVSGSGGISRADCASYDRLRTVLPELTALLSHEDPVVARTHAARILEDDHLARADLSPETRAAIRNMRSLATSLMTAPDGAILAPGNLAAHMQTVATLANTLNTHDCADPADRRTPSEDPGTGETDTGTGDGEGHKPDPAGTPTQRITLGTLRDASPVLTLVCILAAIGLGTVAYLAYRRVQRRNFRRYSVGVTVKVRETPDTPALHRFLLDISRGGAKVSWRDGPDRGTVLIATLAGADVEASVAWRNPHYIGLLFNPPLPEDLIRAVLREGNTGLRSPLETKTAPEAGAAS